MLTLLGCLQERRFWTGAELAHELAVTPRCIRRDVQRLRDLGYPVHATGGVGGGYSLGAGEKLPPLPLDEDEAMAVAIGLRIALTGSVADLAEPTARALAKLEAVLPRALRGRVEAVQVATRAVPEPRLQVDPRRIAALAGACRDGVVLRFGYVDRAGRRTRRRVEPYRLLHTGWCWYLLAWDRTREAWRTFRVDRMEEPFDRGGPFDRRAISDAEIDAFALALPADTRPVQARMRVLASAAHTREEVGRYGRVEAIDDTTCWLHVGGEDPLEIARGLLYTDLELRDVEPKAVRDAFEALASRLRRAAGG